MSSKNLVIISRAPLERKNKPESEKFSHSEVDYENPSTHPHEECEDCEHFIPETDEAPAGCEGVQKPIAEGAWCKRFKRDTMKKHKFSHTVIEHHHDNSHSVHHIHEKHGFQGPAVHDDDVKSAVGDHDAMMDHVMDHTSSPNPGEGKDVANAPMAAAGAPPAVAPPAGA
jgi:hypothetical protein